MSVDSRQPSWPCNMPSIPSVVLCCKKNFFLSKNFCLPNLRLEFRGKIEILSTNISSIGNLQPTVVILLKICSVLRKTATFCATYFFQSMTLLHTIVHINSHQCLSMIITIWQHLTKPVSCGQRQASRAVPKIRHSCCKIIRGRDGDPWNHLWELTGIPHLIRAFALPYCHCHTGLSLEQQQLSLELELMTLVGRWGQWLFSTAVCC